MADDDDNFCFISPLTIVIIIYSHINIVEYIRKFIRSHAMHSDLKILKVYHTLQVSIINSKNW